MSKARKRNREKELVRRRERYANDPDFRAKLLENVRKRYDRMRAEKNEYSRQYYHEHYANDPDFRARELERKNRIWCERYANDPDFRARHIERKRMLRRERRAKHLDLQHLAIQLLISEKMQ